MKIAVLKVGGCYQLCDGRLAKLCELSRQKLILGGTDELVWWKSSTGDNFHESAKSFQQRLLGEISERVFDTASHDRLAHHDGA